MFLKIYLLLMVVLMRIRYTGKVEGCNFIYLKKHVVN
ncbi:Uncharacterised protein [Enterobacter hormaechei]|nr:Uncharacterised protein [Enterobacter hormaechei]SAC78568.1 Uncharacterised protein [Enterobacter hormaechei]SAH01799.1 Uncharacterised protein [Enterobacter hormaechei]SAI65070.1 Uncharacterised protein [Enterobacter hormaechei]